MGANKITGLAAATTNGDAVRWEQIHSASHSLDGHTGPVGNLTLNSKKIISLANGTVAQDAMAFGQKYTNAEAVSAVAAGDDYLKLVGDTMGGVINMGANKITGLAAATTNGDAVRWEQIHSASHSLDGHTGPVGNLTLNSKKIISLANGTVAQDAMAFGQKYTNAEAVSAVAAGDDYLKLVGDTMGGVINMGANKITGLAAATANGDAVRWEQIHSASHSLDGHTGPVGNLTLNSKKIISLANGTVAQDAMAFGQKYTNAEAVSAVAAGDDYLKLVGDTMGGVINMGANKITGLAAATANGDAVRWEQIHSASHSLDGHTGPVGNLTLNSKKIISLANGTVAQDAMAFGQKYTNAEAVQAAEDAGLILSATKTITTGDEDTAHTFGRAALGSAADIAYWAHRDQLARKAIVQLATGAVSLDSSTSIALKQGGNIKLGILSAGVQLSGGAIVTTIENNDSLGTSDTKLCTQGNVKAYADTKTTAAAAHAYVEANALTLTEDLTMSGNDIILGASTSLRVDGTPADATYTGSSVLNIDTTGCATYDVVYIDGVNSV
ncbi:hypothetical protein LCGC14_2353020, partial [marine sediment metagenome]